MVFLLLERLRLDKRTYVIVWPEILLARQ